MTKRKPILTIISCLIGVWSLMACHKTERLQQLDKDEVQVWLNKSRKEIVVRMAIDMDTEGDPSSKLFNLTSEVNKCFVINRKSLTRRM